MRLSNLPRKAVTCKIKKVMGRKINMQGGLSPVAGSDNNAYEMSKF
jgi:hypothetical protein